MNKFHSKVLLQKTWLLLVRAIWKFVLLILITSFRPSFSYWNFLFSNRLEPFGEITSHYLEGIWGEDILRWYWSESVPNSKCNWALVVTALKGVSFPFCLCYGQKLYHRYTLLPISRFSSTQDLYKYLSLEFINHCRHALLLAGNRHKPELVVFGSDLFAFCTLSWELCFFDQCWLYLPLFIFRRS